MASNAFYEFREWHSSPTCDRQAIPCGWASGVMLVCIPCGCASELEATGGRSTLLEAAVVTATVAVPATVSGG